MATLPHTGQKKVSNKSDANDSNKNRNKREENDLIIGNALEIIQMDDLNDEGKVGAVSLDG